MSWPHLENVAYPWLAGAVGAVVGLKFVIGTTWLEPKELKGLEAAAAQVRFVLGARPGRAAR